MLNPALHGQALGAGAGAPPTFDTMPYAQWMALAVQRLHSQWPEAEARRLHDIADELFADPRSGMLDPQQAVEDWLRLLSGCA